MKISRKAIITVAFLIWCLLEMFPCGMKLSAADMVRYRTGTVGAAENEETLSGKIRKSTVEGVVIAEDGKDQKISANRIVWTQFEKEPINLTTARTLMQTSRYDEVIAKLNEIPAGERSSATPLVLADWEYLLASATAGSALARKNHDDLITAGRMLREYTKTYSDSWQMTGANELIVEILLALDKPGNAREFFDFLAARPWADVKLKAMNSSAAVSLMEKKYDESLKAYDAVIAFSAEDSTLVRREKMLAQAGRNRVLIAQGKYDDAIAAIQKLIASTPATESDDVMARLYNTLGEACVAGGKVKQAILAYLHTDLLYSTSRVEHVAALRALYRLWKQDFREDRAAEVLKILRNEYKIVDSH
ncbi:MAG: hypothetical protein PHQ75_08620 [Thermoguttaceae bacterium]|nr:hypothetical protein [Thermoguttaceae bacterium]